MIRSLLALALIAAALPAAARPPNQADLVGLDRVSDAHVSPDGRWAVYDLSVLNEARTGRTHQVWRVATDGKGQPQKLADGTNPRFGPDAGVVWYLAKGQVWQVCPDCRTGEARQVTDLPLEVDGFRVSPDGRRLVVALSVFPDAEDPAATKARLDARPLSSARAYDRLFVRHWDKWADGRRNHLFSLRLDGGKAAGAAVPLMPGFDGDAPGKPFGGDADYAITPDGKSVLFAARLAGRTEPWSTDFEIYSVPIEGGARPVNVSPGNQAWDADPTPSPSGRYAAHRAMKRPAFEADRFGVMLFDSKTFKLREVAPAWDRSADEIAFAGDERTIYVKATDDGSNRLFQMDIATGAVKPLATGGGSVAAMDVANAPGGDVIVYLRDAQDHPAEVFALRPGGEPIQLTHATERGLQGVEFQHYFRFQFPGWNGETVKGWIVQPAGWKRGETYPTILMIHGGPQGSWTDSWSTRWNAQVWAGWGYGVVMIDPHGSTGYGQAFTDAISSHWGDRPLEDLQKGWTAIQAKAPWIDADRACAAGASYGGFMAYWIAGVWSAPFKCLISHDGVFDNRIMGYATEELWFSEWENGHATPWADPAAYERFNPVNHVAAWKTPMLVIHSDQDFRIPVDQGVAAFTALQRKGIESRFLNFPDENHWVLKPQNSLVWHDTIQQWLGAHLK